MGCGPSQLDLDKKLLNAAKSGDVAAARAALNGGAMLECRDKNGYTPLHTAAYEGHLACVRLLLERGADKEAKDCYGRTPLHYAAREGHLEVSQLLLERGTNKEARDRGNKTALNFAKDDAMRALLRNSPAQNSSINSGAASQAAASAAAKREADAAAAEARRVAEARAAAAERDKAAKAVADAEAARKAAEALAAAERSKRQTEADAAAQQATAAARAVAEAEAARQAAEARAAALERERTTAAEKAARASTSVPVELATWLASLELSEHGAKLVADHKLRFVQDCRVLDRDDLLKSGLVKVEAERFLKAAAKLGGESKRLSGVSAAPAEDSAPSPAGPRVCVRALVIGINGYAPPPSGPGRLDNAVADATAVHKALSALPGAASTLLTDCSKVEFEQALRDFRDSTGACKERGMRVTAANRAPAGKVMALIFFAGHGLQVAGRNYLVPKDFTVPRKNDNAEVMKKDTARACVSLESVEEILGEAGMFAGAVLLDCCRNVPDFLAELGCTRAVGATRALPSGMAEARPSLDNLLVAYATKPGECALDRSTRLVSHSPFTAALLRSFEAPRRLNDLSMFLVDEVKRDTGDKQCPQALATWGTEAGTLLLG